MKANEKPNRSKAVLILILGCMTALSPFSIDMYLPAFQQIAASFGTTVAQVSLSLSSYFVGLACGQLFYGPILDRYGRKRPLYIGIGIYMFSCFLCLLSKDTETLVAARFLQALGGCVAGVGSMAMVRDLFSLQESAKVYSLLILILGTSPLLAPTVGGLLATYFTWHSIFIALAVMASGLLLAIRFGLAESHRSDPAVSLHPWIIFLDYLEILRNPGFYAFAVSGAIAFSGLFVYLAGSPVIFLETYQVTAQQYGWIFAIVASGMIVASQFNVTLLRRFSTRQVLIGAMLGQVLVGVILCLGSYFDFLGLWGTVVVLFLFFSSFGLSNPNAGALALAPFSRNAGRASALLGFLQIGVGALASTSVGLFSIKTILPIAGVMVSTCLLAFGVLLIGIRMTREDRS